MTAHRRRRQHFTQMSTAQETSFLCRDEDVSAAKLASADCNSVIKCARQVELCQVRDHGALTGPKAKTIGLTRASPARVILVFEARPIPPRSWAERAYHKLIYYNQVDKGAHYAAWEQPQLFSEEVRAGFRALRT